MKRITPRETLKLLQSQYASNLDPVFHGARGLSPKKVCEKLSRKKSWLWQRLKTDPDFPRPVYLSPGAPLFFEHELDAYLAKCAERTRKAAA